MRGKPGPKGIDWKAARDDYVTAGYVDALTYADIAAKYGVCPSTVWKRGAAERWKKRRKAHREKVSRRELRRVMKEQVEAAVERILERNREA